MLLFIHELGHMLEAKRQGLDVSWPQFIPFLGAMITMREMPPNAWREAQVALAGPLLGTVGALGTWAIGSSINSRAVVALAFVGFFLNLFNLLPVVPLDGGRAVAALHPALWSSASSRWGAGLLPPELHPLPHPGVRGDGAVAALEVARQRRMAGYYQVKPWQRAAVAVTYFGLAAFLVFAMNATHVPRNF